MASLSFTLSNGALEESPTCFYLVEMLDLVGTICIGRSGRVEGAAERSRKRRTALLERARAMKAAAELQELAESSIATTCSTQSNLLKDLEISELPTKATSAYLARMRSGNSDAPPRRRSMVNLATRRSNFADSETGGRGSQFDLLSRARSIQNVASGGPSKRSQAMEKARSLITLAVIRAGFAHKRRTLVELA